MKTVLLYGTLFYYGEFLNGTFPAKGILRGKIQVPLNILGNNFVGSETFFTQYKCNYY